MSNQIKSQYQLKNKIQGQSQEVHSYKNIKSNLHSKSVDSQKLNELVHKKFIHTPSDDLSGVIKKCFIRLSHVCKWINKLENLNRHRITLLAKYLWIGIFFMDNVIKTLRNS